VPPGTILCEPAGVLRAVRCDSCLGQIKLEFRAGAGKSAKRRSEKVMLAASFHLGVVVANRRAASQPLAALAAALAFVVRNAPKMVCPGGGWGPAWPKGEVPRCRIPLVAAVDGRRLSSEPLSDIYISCRMGAPAIARRSSGVNLASGMFRTKRRHLLRRSSCVCTTRKSFSRQRTLKLV